MKDQGGEIFYVGKANNLRSRLKQYFGKSSDTRAFVALLDEILHSLEFIVTDTEKEALILEAALIKRHQPRYNVLLKDGKSFLHLRLDPRLRWPRLEVIREPKPDGALHFGPYHMPSQIRSTLKLLERHFQLRTCDDLSFKNRSRPCLQHQIKRCLGPCTLPVDQTRYRAQMEEVILFLKGQHRELIDQLEEQMQSASQALAFERAAQLRDQIKAIQSSLERQRVTSMGRADRDILGLYREGSQIQATILFIRQGQLVGSESHSLVEPGIPEARLSASLLNLFYDSRSEIPSEILLAVEPEGLPALSERLRELATHKVSIRVPQRGDGLRLLEMAVRNAEHAFFQGRREESLREGALIRLKERLMLSNLPQRIECFDISLFQGDSAVGSKVCFEGGAPLRSAYRHYKIRSVEGTDDYAMMREVLTRRLKRGLVERELPQLIVIDGGKGQLSVAQAVLKDLKIDGLDLVGLAKARVLSGVDDQEGGSLRSPERAFVPGRKNPIILRPHSDELALLCRLRDEAHRFAIQHHRKLRQKRTMSSPLDEIQGVGTQRKRQLLRAFGSLKALREAHVEELMGVEGIGPKLAQQIYEHLDKR